jgi:hypothetical protein
LKYKIKVKVLLSVECRGGGDFSIDGLRYKKHKTAHALYIYNISFYFPDPVEDIRNPLNK